MFFKNKKRQFSILLNNIAANLKDATHFFSQFEIKNISDLKILSETMKDFETKGDTYIHEMIVELNHTLVTPIDRGDIMSLAMSMDDVLDGLEHCSALFEMYSITRTDQYMDKFTECIVHCTNEIEESINLLANRKYSQIRIHAIKIKDYESQCDGIQRQSIKHLFSVEKDVIRLIQFKEIYDDFENVADHCQDVANTLETIVMKHA
jgi:predicted phosphate transport protein (TIGR00153 family)